MAARPISPRSLSIGWSKKRVVNRPPSRLRPQHLITKEMLRLHLLVNPWSKLDGLHLRVPSPKISSEVLPPADLGLQPNKSRQTRPVIEPQRMLSPEKVDLLARGILPTWPSNKPD
jgi:hypothetical protein